MAGPITDPALLAQLEGGERTPVSDPNLLAQLEGGGAGPAMMPSHGAAQAPPGKLASFGAGANRALHRAMSFISGALPIVTPEARQYAEQSLPGAEAEAQKASAAHPYLTGAGSLATEVGMTAPLMAAGGAVLGPAGGLATRGVRALSQALPSALSGAMFAPEGQRGRAALTGAVAGPALGAVTEAGSALAEKALPLANRLAVSYFQPGPRAVKEARDIYGALPHQASDEAMQQLGSQIRGAGLVKPFQSWGQRFEKIAGMNKAAGDELQQTISSLDQAGATFDRGAIIRKLADIRDQYFAKPGTEEITGTMTSGKDMMNKLIARIQNSPELATGNPISNANNLKRILQQEGFLSPSAQYVSSEAVAADPSGKALRQASRAVRGEVEQGALAADPVLGQKMIDLNQQLHKGSLVEELAREAEQGRFAGAGTSPMEHASTPHSLKWRALGGGMGAMLQHGKPLAVSGLESVNAVRPTAAYMDPIIRALLIQQLRGGQ